MQETILAALKAEKRLHQQLEELKHSIYTDVKKGKPLTGVIVLKGSCIASVKFSTLSNSGNWLLTPSYYLQESQAEAVMSRLQGAETVTKLIKRLKEMVDDKEIRISGTNVVKLNENTISILQAYINET